MRPHVSPPIENEPEEGAVSRVVAWIVGHKALATTIGSMVIIAGIMVDAALWSGKGIRYGCSYVSEEWRDRLPCPSKAPATVNRGRETDDRGPSSPAVDVRQLLSSWGYTWNNEDSFWSAIAQSDTKAIPLFLQEGMIVRAERLHGILGQPIPRKDAVLAAMLVDAQKHNAEFCSIDKVLEKPQSVAAARRQFDSFAAHASDPALVDFVKAFCRGYPVAASLREAVAQENAQIANAKSKNEATMRERTKCNGELASHDVRKRLGFLTDAEETQAKRANKSTSVGDMIAEQPCQSPRTQRESALCRWLSDGRNVSDGYLWVPAVNRFCEGSYRLLPADTSRRDTLMKAAEVYGG